MLQRQQPWGTRQLYLCSAGQAQFDNSTVTLHFLGTGAWGSSFQALGSLANLGYFQRSSNCGTDSIYSY